MHCPPTQDSCKQKTRALPHCSPLRLHPRISHLEFRLLLLLQSYRRSTKSPMATSVAGIIQRPMHIGSDFHRNTRVQKKHPKQNREGHLEAHGKLGGVPGMRSTRICEVEVDLAAEILWYFEPSFLIACRAWTEYIWCAIYCNLQSKSCIVVASKIA